VLGNQGISLFGNMGITTMDDSMRFELKEVKKLGETARMTYH